MTAQAQAATIRPGREDDVEAIEMVLLAHDEGPAGEPRVAPGAYHRYFRHLLTRGTVVVAEAGSSIVGFGASVDTGRAVHLADLFVLPDAIGEGIGRRLVEAVYPEGRPRTTFASDDPRAMHLYVGLGMTPLWPNFYLTGTASRLPPTAGAVAVDVSWEEAAALELAWTGIDRSADYRLWSQRPGNRWFVVRGTDEAIAAGVSRARIRGSGRWLDRLIPGPGTDPTTAIVAALSHAADDDGVIGACVMGPNPALKPLLVECGFRIADRDTFMATDPELLDPRGIYDTGIP
ncbi:MAG TPA: GNAT family N-acetyltransferase [Candidatus Limnocylindrales bacterium]|nr:GNAT family N-acetyltransferase [Candidatus Limnocylindrales bacterium]